MDLSSIFRFSSFAVARQVSEKRRRRAAICRRLASETLEPRRLLSSDPVAQDDHYQTYADGTFVVGTERGLLANATPVPGENLAAAAVSQPQHGKLTLQPDGSFR